MDTVQEQRIYLESLKRRKIQRREEEEQRGRVPCPRCGGSNHNNARSRLCPFNRYFGVPTAAMVRQQNRQGRAAGQERLRLEQANLDVPRCQRCILPDGTNDGCLHHGNTASHLCHAHKTSMDDIVSNVLGPRHHSFVRRCTLKRTLTCFGRTRRQRLSAKIKVIREVERVVDHVRNVSIKAMLFVQHHVLKMLSAGEPIPPTLGMQGYVYGVMQLVIGKQVTNTNPNLPQDTANAFQAYVEQFDASGLPTVDPLPGYSQCYAHMAKTLATTIKNCLTEAFEPRCKAYIAFKLRTLISRTDKPKKKELKKLVNYVYSKLSGEDPANEPAYARQSWERAVATVLETTSLGPQPVTFENLTAKFYEYVPVMYKFLEEMEAHSTAQTDQPSEWVIVDEADSQYCRELLSAVDGFDDLGRRQKAQVQRATHKFMNSPALPLNFGPRMEDDMRQAITALIRTTRFQLSMSHQYLQGNDMIDPSLCFKSHSSLWIINAGPEYSLKPAGVQPRLVDDQLFLTQLGEHTQQESDLQQVGKKFLVFWKTLNFKKANLSKVFDTLGTYNTDLPPEETDIAFTNLIRTDGHTVEFICSKKAAELLPDLVMSDLDDEDMEVFKPMGVDPGHSVLFTSMDTNRQCLRLTNPEFYHRIGHMRRRYTRQNNAEQLGINPIISSLPTKKTVSVSRWMAYCRQLCLCLPSLTNFYGSAFTNDRFLAYVSKQKILDEAVNIFVSDGRKYRKSKARRGVDVDDDENDEGDEDGEDERPNIPLLMLGSGVFGFTRQGKKTRMSIIPKLKAAEKEGRLLVCVVNEAYTSQVCCFCHHRSLSTKRALDPLTNATFGLWAVKYCRVCRTNVNRDKSAATNILHLGLREQEHLDRPAVFCRH
ncbi:hypothetical protein DM01DRAFT_1408636 [Hesseltinella vesiculosa]|uniref:Cas12f1-like TNB domain-containing protein n=1 Tax=Hesseltinella vesiculosa TaxID=101127 RepID=A0A1X2GE65_9FUNG|nr:hypothetical protein DM01DRAFT_1408636 [Hesseltinella vesiculosa]